MFIYRWRDCDGGIPPAAMADGGGAGVAVKVREMSRAGGLPRRLVPPAAAAAWAQ